MLLVQGVFFWEAQYSILKSLIFTSIFSYIGSRENWLLNRICNYLKKRIVLSLFSGSGAVKIMELYEDEPNDDYESYAMRQKMQPHGGQLKMTTQHF